MSGPRKISIKWKIFGLVAVLISAAVALIVLQTNSIFRQDKEAFVKELSAKLASSTAQNLASRITMLQDKLVIFISSKESLSHTGAKMEDQLSVLYARYQEFLSIGFMGAGAPGTMKVDWALRNPQSEEVGRWPAGYEKKLLENLDTTKAAEQGRGYWRAQAPDGTWLSILGFAVQVLDPRHNKTEESRRTAWIIGILPHNAFQDLLSDFGTGLNTGFIVDDQGYAIAHSDPSQSWKNFKTHPLIAEVLKNKRPGGAGDYRDMEGRPVIGSFEAIPKMNLSVVVTTPRDKAFEAANELQRTILIIGALILLVALGLAVLFSNYMAGPLQKLAVIAAEIGAGNFNVPIDVKTNDEIGELANSFLKMEKGLFDRDEALASAQGALVQSEKMGAFGQLSAGIAHEVKNPLAGILGHVQLALGKIQNDDIRKHLEVIEKETRRCKTIVENLMKFARQEKAVLEPTDLAQACQDTINLVDHQLSLAGCKILKDFQPCPLVEANSNQLQQVLLNLMVNASHAMEKSETKNVTVRVCQVDNKAQIQIADTGAGIPPEIQKKIFEPFFTTKPAGKGTGLGLSVSIGIVKEHKGDIYLRSEMGQGTTFFLDFPLAANAKMPDKPLENTHGGKDISHQTQAPTKSSKPTPMTASPRKPLVEPLTKVTPAATALAASTTQTPTKNVGMYKPTSQRTGLEYKLEGTPPPPPKSDSPYLKADEILSKAQQVKDQAMGAIKSFEKTAGNGSAAQQPPPIPAVESADDPMIIDFSMDEEPAAPQITTTTTAVMPPPLPGVSAPVPRPESSDGSSENDFKVKINRPKIKG